MRSSKSGPPEARGHDRAAGAGGRTAGAGGRGGRNDRRRGAAPRPALPATAAAPAVALRRGGGLFRIRAGRRGCGAYCVPLIMASRIMAGIIMPKPAPMPMPIVEAAPPLPPCSAILAMLWAA